MAHRNVADAIMSIEEAASTLVDPSAYADGRMLEACAVLRRESPVHWVDADGFRPFFALTRHSDIRQVETANDLFHASPRYKLARGDLPSVTARSLVSMDPPDHSDYRGLVAEWFRPRGLRVLEDDVRVLAKTAVDAMAERGGVYDFVTDVAMQLPLAVICSMLGIPQEDRELILRMTLLNFGSEDPEYQQLVADIDNPLGNFAQYVSTVIEDRLTNPTTDISSLLAHATLRGESLPQLELLGFYGILATAGHDTTSSTMAGGVQALIEHPDQLQRLREDISLVPSAVEEMIRWTSPVNSFMRTATADTEIGGHPVAAGDAVLLLYSSANHDEDVFVQPERFDVTRKPNKHLAFGHGAHFCLGAHLARLELQIFFTELIPRLRHIELAGEPEKVRTLFVGGLKHLPIRAEIV